MSHFFSADPQPVPTPGNGCVKLAVCLVAWKPGIEALDIPFRLTHLPEAAALDREAIQQMVNESIARAIVSYPDATKEGSGLFVALQAETECLRAISSPILLCSEWPEYVSAKVASSLGILPES